MPKPKLLGLEYAPKARPVRESWQTAVAVGGEAARDARGKLKSLATFEARAKADPLKAGNVVQRDRWPKSVKRDYGEIANLFRFELADRWRAYYTIAGEPGGARIWVLYLWDHETYDRASGYGKK